MHACLAAGQTWYVCHPLKPGAHTDSWSIGGSLGGGGQVEDGFLLYTGKSFILQHYKDPAVRLAVECRGCRVSFVQRLWNVRCREVAFFSEFPLQTGRGVSSVERSWSVLCREVVECPL